MVAKPGNRVRLKTEEIGRGKSTSNAGVARLGSGCLRLRTLQFTQIEFLKLLL